MKKENVLERAKVQLEKMFEEELSAWTSEGSVKVKDLVAKIAYAEIPKRLGIYEEHYGSFRRIDERDNGLVTAKVAKYAEKEALNILKNFDMKLTSKEKAGIEKQLRRIYMKEIVEECREQTRARARSDAKAFVETITFIEDD